MCLPPEILDIPKTALQFPTELTRAIAIGMLIPRPRNLVDDAELYLRKRDVRVEGAEHIGSGPYYIYINHPRIPHLIDGLFALINAIFKSRTDLKIVMMDLSPLRFASIWPEHLITVPNSLIRRRLDKQGYRLARQGSRDEIRQYLVGGHMVILAPEGRVSPNDQEVQKKRARHGAGDIAVWATQNGIPQVPVAICPSSDKTTCVKIGSPFFVTAQEGQDAVGEMMERLSVLLSPGEKNI
jgi:1-acyl-sn-glycerol-3-phosphate acyltransferase